jgi:hypothetical protein
MAIEVEAPITDKNKIVCIYLGGVIAWNYFLWKRNKV